MEYILFGVILLQFVYIVYKDYISLKEREKLELKLMSKDVGEYVATVEDSPADTVQEEDPYIPAEAASIEQILGAEDRT